MRGTEDDMEGIEELWEGWCGVGNATVGECLSEQRITELIDGARNWLAENGKYSQAAQKHQTSNCNYRM
jgi:hypothetical protein